MRKSKKCHGQCEICKEVNCPDDFRVSCFGEKCESCSKNCQLKNIGSRKAVEKRAESYASRKRMVQSTVHLVEELDLPVPDRAETGKSELELARLDATRRVIFFYLEHPAEFEQYVLSFFCGKTQTDVAKAKGVSRQNISKKIILERGDRLKKEIEDLKRKNSAFSKMTATELKIYQLCGEDGILNVSNIAKQANCSRQTVYNTLHILSSKYGFHFTLDRDKKEKN